MINDSIDVYQAFNRGKKAFQGGGNFLLNQPGRSIGPTVTDGEIIGRPGRAQLDIQNRDQTQTDQDKGGEQQDGGERRKIS